MKKALRTAGPMAVKKSLKLFLSNLWVTIEAPHQSPAVKKRMCTSAGVRSKPPRFSQETRPTAAASSMTSITSSAW